MSASTESTYYDYLHGGLLNGKYLRVKGLNEGSFGIVSIAKDVTNNDQLVAVKYNTGCLSDFETYQNEQKTKSHAVEVRSFSLNSKTKSAIKSHTSFSNTDKTDKNVSKSIVIRETQQEIAMLRKVDSHPNITTLFDYFDTYMVLEYAPRGDLHDAIQLGIAPVATRDVIDVFMQLIGAVEFCHQNGVYHRDIKPENILITDDWSIRLTDFGLATEKLICSDFDVGSERYMAPELLEHSDIDSYAADKVDIWALGICLLNIVFGKSPFRSASSKDKMFLHFAANRETLFDIFPSMSYDLFTVMMHSLTIDPANRDLEMIKRTLLSIDILTYDYEFEEEYADDMKTHELSESPEEIPQISSRDSTNHVNVPILEKPATTEPLMHINSKPQSGMEVGGSSPPQAHRVPSRPTTPQLIITHDSGDIHSIDTILESKDDEDQLPIVSPITIQKKYEPPHKLLSHTSLSKYFVDLKNRRPISNHQNNNNNNNNNNNKNHRVKRWNNAHRKPLRIANSNLNTKIQDERLLSYHRDDYFDFNRKDFFTPKSVFSNYMEKANRGRQQLQQRGINNRKHGNYEKSNEYMNNYKYSHHYNHYDCDDIDRRAWQKRKRRPSHMGRNVNYNRNNNKSSYRGNNRSMNRDNCTKSRNNDRNSQKQRKLSTIENMVLSRSSRASIDGKYVPPNVRLEAAHLMGSAIDSDDEDDYDYSTRSRRSMNSYNSKFRRGSRLHDVLVENNESEEDEYEDEGFTFEFDDPEPSFRSRDISNLISNFNDDKRFNQIQAHAISNMTKQMSEAKIFDDKVAVTRDTSQATTVSQNQSSTGSNINNSPPGNKKYVPPHQRRSSHSGDSMIKPTNSNSKDNYNQLVDRINYRYMSPVSSSAPTKATSFFNASSKMNHHDYTLKDYQHNILHYSDDNSDDLFNIDED